MYHTKVQIKNKIANTITQIHRYIVMHVEKAQIKYNSNTVQGNVDMQKRHTPSSCYTIQYSPCYNWAPLAKAQNWGHLRIKYMRIRAFN